MLEKVEVINGGFFADDRGSLQYVNAFDFINVKRFYQINHPETNVVRAWQGHKIEHKYFYVCNGSFVIAWVEIDDWEIPSATLQASHIILTAQDPKIVSVPKGYANGIKALEKDSALMIFSNMTLEGSAMDRISFDSHLWFDWDKF